MERAQTLGQLKASGYRPRSVRQELRENLAAALRAGRDPFPGILGYEHSVVPQLENAILAGHDFILLGLRGQAKTRILRSLSALLDDAVPVVPGTALNEDPLAPLTESTRRRIEAEGDGLAITWLPRADRYREKLATPDVTVADLIGDVDPIKAATRGLALDDPEVIQYGLIPRTNRGIFAVNELPDLQARIQVALLNLLEEGDVQIRSFPVRLPLDMLLVFSANPEDYTNRGSIITPLRDRIASQILTHYPRCREVARAITDQEAWIEREGPVAVTIPEALRAATEEVAFVARESPWVDQNSGVSARLGIALLEAVWSNAERRALRSGAQHAVVRPSDLLQAAPAITGKVELVYEGEREGAQKVARSLLGGALGRAFETVWQARFPDVEEADEVPCFEPILGWFAAGNQVDLTDELTDADLQKRLSAVPGLAAAAHELLPGETDAGSAMEFVLEGLHQASLLSKQELEGGQVFRDSFQDMVRTFHG